MLRIFHTADWHLGQSFHGYDRDFEHAQFLAWLLDTLLMRRPDVLLVAGDVFDSVNPSASALRRFYDFLARAHSALPDLQMVLIAGNHDAAARLEAPAGLFESLKIAVVGTVARDPQGALRYEKFLIPLRAANGEVAAIALAIPFLRPADVPEVPGCSDAYLEGIGELYRQSIAAGQSLRDRCFPGAALLGLGHCHLQDAVESRDSERRIVIGGAEALGTEIFPAELAYVALGHLHKPQEFAGGRIQYCGSPIPLSFSEKDYAHRIVEVELAQDGAISSKSLLVPRTASLIRLPAHEAAPLAEVLKMIEAAPFQPELPPEAYPFLEVRLVEDGPDPTRRRQIEQALEGKPVRLASIKMEANRRLEEAKGAECAPQLTLADLGSLDPEAIMLSAHLEKYQSEASPALLAALREILTETQLVAE